MRLLILCRLFCIRNIMMKCKKASEKLFLYGVIFLTLVIAGICIVSEFLNKFIQKTGERFIELITIKETKF